MKTVQMKTFYAFLLFVFALALSAAPAGERVLRSAVGSRAKTLDPVLADDLASRDLCGAFYDTLLEYDYLARPYRLKPAMLAAMPETSADFKIYRFRLRPDLFFAPDSGGKAKKITAADVRFSLLRLADARLHSPVYWILRGKLLGLDEFHAATAAAKPGDFSLYDRGIAGFVITGELEFELHLTHSDPRFLYLLAMPNTGIVARGAAESGKLASHPAGSGPFVLKKWVRDCRIELERNPAYRTEFFPGAERREDRLRPLPLVDRIVLYQVRQATTAWLLFLQGNLDYHALDKDNLDLAAGQGDRPAPELAARGVRLLRMPEFEIRYVGFNFRDSVLGKNLALRRALSLAYDVRRRVEHAGGQLLPAQGPIPPGVAGYRADFRNPWAADDPERAAEVLAQAGFSGGIDPKTGEAYRLTFDQSGNTASYRQLGELAAADFGRLGISVEPVLNNNPRFYEKLRQGRFQLFRLSWVGDYPDAENFLQLFYSGNIGGCNRTGFSDPVYDKMYEAILPMADSPERTRRYEEMATYLAERCPWIFEGFPVSYVLCHRWLGNFVPHDFGFAKWKYLAVDPAEREAAVRTFTPISFGNGK